MNPINNDYWVAFLQAEAASLLVDIRRAVNASIINGLRLPAVAGCTTCEPLEEPGGQLFARKARRGPHRYDSSSLFAFTSNCQVPSVKKRSANTETR